MENLGNGNSEKPKKNWWQKFVEFAFPHVKNEKLLQQILENNRKIENGILELEKNLIIKRGNSAIVFAQNLAVAQNLEIENLQVLAVPNNLYEIGGKKFGMIFRVFGKTKNGDDFEMDLIAPNLNEDVFLPAKFL